MNKPSNPILTKSCANCGLQKPLSAFLEMSSTEGAIYGNICSSCRKTALEEIAKRKKTDAEGSSSSESGHTIDSKVKVKTTVDNREFIARTEEEYHAERKIDEEISENKQERKATFESSQKKHRQDFLQKRTFLGDAKNTGKASAAQQLRTDVIKGNEQTAKQAISQKEERIKTGLDFTVAHQGEQIAGQMKYRGKAFLEFMTRVASAPISKTVNQKKAAAAQTEKAHEEETPSAVEFIEKNWRPGGKR